MTGTDTAVLPLGTRSPDVTDIVVAGGGLAGLELLGTDRVESAQFAQPPGFWAGLPDVDEPAVVPRR